MRDGKDRDGKDRDAEGRDAEGRGRDEAFERDDSRWLDDELAPATRERVGREQAEQPDRARGAARLRAALDLWADDARRTAAQADADRTTRGVLARLAADPDGRAYLPARASWSYVAAAAALLGLGVGGLCLYEPRRAGAPELPGVTAELERDSLAVLRSVEIETLAVEGR